MKWKGGIESYMEVNVVNLREKWMGWQGDRMIFVGVCS